jgi:hypothetical protein
MQTIDSNPSNSPLHDSQKNPNTNTQNESQKFSNELDNFEKIFKIWEKYEDIAMHFNELLIKLRIQALGGIAIIGTLATTLLKESNVDLRQYLLPLFFLLTVGWLALYFLDMYYYNCLLQGAVESIITIEKQDNRLKLSTTIEKEVKKHKIFKIFSAKKLFYLIIYVALSFIDLYYLSLNQGLDSLWWWLILIFLCLTLLLFLEINYSKQ